MQLLVETLFNLVLHHGTGTRRACYRCGNGCELWGPWRTARSTHGHQCTQHARALCLARPPVHAARTATRARSTHGHCPLHGHQSTQHARSLSLARPPVHAARTVIVPCTSNRARSTHSHQWTQHARQILHALSLVYAGLLVHAGN